MGARRKECHPRLRLKEGSTKVRGRAVLASVTGFHVLWGRRVGCKVGRVGGKKGL